MPDGLIDTALISGIDARPVVAPPSSPTPSMGALWSVDVFDLCSPELRGLHEYWRQKRGKRMFPSRSDIDPLDFANALGQVSLVQVEGSPVRFRYRLVGSNASQHLGCHLTGRYTEDLTDPGVRAMVEALYRGAVSLRRPLANRGETRYAGERWIWETICLPLASRPATIDMLLTGEVCHKAA
jgi:hypothetical protein